MEFGQGRRAGTSARAYFKDKRKDTMRTNMSRILTKFALAAALFCGIGAAPSAAFADGWFSCEPSEVLAFSNRVHVRCDNTWAAGSSSIRYIAVGVSDADAAARFVSLANAALLSNKFFRVYLLTSSTTNTSGCGSSDCRTPTAYGVMNR